MGGGRCDAEVGRVGIRRGGEVGVRWRNWDGREVW